MDAHSPSRQAVVLVSIFHFLFSHLPSRANGEEEKADLLVSGGTIVTMDGQRRILRRGHRGKGRCDLALGARAEIESNTPRRKYQRQGRIGTAWIHQWAHARSDDPFSRAARRCDAGLNGCENIFFPRSEERDGRIVRWGTRSAVAEQIRAA